MAHEKRLGIFSAMKLAESRRAEAAEAKADAMNLGDVRASFDGEEELRSQLVEAVSAYLERVDGSKSSGYSSIHDAQDLGRWSDNIDAILKEKGVEIIRPDQNRVAAYRAIQSIFASSDAEPDGYDASNVIRLFRKKT